MDNQPPETRIKLLEGRMSTAEERITTHGKEIDAITEQIVRTQERAEKWDKDTWIVVSVVITAVATALIARIGF